MTEAEARCHVVKKMGYLKSRESRIHLLKRITPELSAIQALCSVSFFVLEASSSYTHNM